MKNPLLFPWKKKTCKYPFFPPGRTCALTLINIFSSIHRNKYSIYFRIKVLYIPSLCAILSFQTDYTRNNRKLSVTVMALVAILCSLNQSLGNRFNFDKRFKLYQGICNIANYLDIVKGGALGLSCAQVGKVENFLVTPIAQEGNNLLLRYFVDIIINHRLKLVKFVLTLDQSFPPFSYCRI